MVINDIFLLLPPFAYLHPILQTGTEAYKGQENYCVTFLGKLKAGLKFGSAAIKLSFSSTMLGTG
jgi:hypothetical protein